MSTKQRTPKTANGYEVHPFAEIWTLREGPPLWELSDDIKANGLRDDIVLHENKVLDGRRRELGCIRAGVKPRYRQFGSRKTDGDDPLAFVISMNDHRRHLTKDEQSASRHLAGEERSKQQRAMAAARLANLTGPGRPEIIGSQEPIISQEEAGELLGVSRSSVRRASAVQRNGSAVLQQAVEDDAVQLKDAAAIASEPHDVQDAAVQAVASGEAHSLQAAVEALAGADGVAIPEAMREIFETVPAFKAILAKLNALKRDVTDLRESLGGRHIREQSIHTDLDNAKRAIRFAMPYAVCPYCKGKGKTKGQDCDACKGDGWTNEAIYTAAPKSTRP